MKRLLLGAAMVIAVASLTAPARADIVPASPFFLDLGATGFGDAHRLLTLQTTPLEVGSTVAGAGGTTILTGDAVAGADKSAVASAAALGWLTGANVGIGLDTNNTGDSVGLAINSIALTLYNSAGTAIQTFNLAAPFSLTEAQLKEQQGNGNSVFNFVLTPTEQAQFTADVLANGGAAAVFAGLGASLGCSSGSLSCEANDGADSFLAFDQVAAVPLPGALPLFGGGLALLGYLGLFKRRKDRGPVSMLNAPQPA